MTTKTDAAFVFRPSVLGPRDSHDLLPMMENNNNRSSALDSSALSNHSPRPRLVLLLLIGSHLITLIFTILPVVIKSSPELSNNRSGHWYNIEDIIRLLEPILSLPFQLSLFIESNFLYISHRSNYLSVLIIILFGISIAIYQQGAGFHSAATMFKHPIEDLIEDTKNSNCSLSLSNNNNNNNNNNINNSINVNDRLEDIYFWIQEIWEHYISHYWYAAGGIGIAAVYAFIYRNDKFDGFNRSCTNKLLFWIAVLLYGLIIGAVSFQFFWGSTVALIFLIIYGFGIIGSALYRREGGFTKIGRWYILQYFFFSYIIGLLLVIAAIISMKGFKKK